ncbi:MAG TPA: hypothetical protein VGQ30_05400, partial [Gemmatimonadaceae bacterium]|nr:hypothetical protein [Gemmatimonadaceae bacterium]
MNDFLTTLHYNSWILPVLLLLPIAGAVAVWVHGRISPMTTPEQTDATTRQLRRIVFAIFMAEAILSLGLWWSVDTSSSNWQAYYTRPWIPMWGMKITLGIDGIAEMLILMTTLIMPLAVLGGWTSIK